MPTKIEWLIDKDGKRGMTWNPITGCSKISEGCKNCYAGRMAKRLAGRYGYPKDEPFKPGTLHPDKIDINLFSPGKKIFVCSMGDLFHDDVNFSDIHEVWSVMKSHPDNIFICLTKRPERMKEVVDRIYSLERLGWANGFWQHVWLGVTAENQEQADKRIPILLQIPAAVPFISCEPMLSEINLHLDSWPMREHCRWVICGGESGPGARPMHPDWARSLRDQCQASGVPFFMKQMSGRTAEERHAIPDDLLIREYPK